MIANSDEVDVQTNDVMPLQAKVKIINPNNSGGHVVEEWNIEKTFDTVSNLRAEMGKVFAKYIGGEFDMW